MPKKIRSSFTINPEILSAVSRIEAIAQKIAHLPITPVMIAKLRETARLQSVHYSTQIEGNRLSEEEIRQVIGLQDQSEHVRKLNLKQRYILSLFADYQVVTARQIAEFLNYKPRTVRDLCAKWVEVGFLKIAEPSKKARKYVLSDQYESLLTTMNKKFF